MGGITTTIGKVKYIGIASLTIAILSILILNIISSYSSSNTLSNAEQVNSGSSSNNEPSTLANDSSICDPTNTNAESCISLSITSSSSSSTGGNDTNLSLTIPQGGGIATGRHTVTVNSNNYTGYYVTLTGNAGSPAMVPSTPTSQAFIQSTTGTLTSPSPLTKGQWGSWGIALPNSSLYPGFNTNEADYNSTNQDVLAKTTWAAVPGKEADDGSKTIIKTTTQSRKTDAYPVYYGVRVDSPVSVPADTYAAQVVYTATTNEVPMPTITSINPDQYELGSGNSNAITISATSGLTSAYKVWIDLNNSQTNTPDSGEECTNLNVVSDTQLTCNLPTDDSITVDTPYTIYVQTQSGEPVSIPNAFTYTKPTGITTITDGTVAVDLDDGMIPVIYNKNTSNWESLTTAEAKTPGTWYSYTEEKKQWANTVTVKEEALGKYQNKHEVVDEADVLGYWVYIPRYAYQVQRKEVSDHYVSDTLASNNGGFNIRFETASDFKKEPVETCSTEDNNMFYTDMNGMESEPNYVGSCHTRTDYPTRKEDYNQTAWATHPAFSWLDSNGDGPELNGFWIGKFETTGTESSPTVLPNEYHQYPSSIGDMYDVAKSMGAEDPNNKYGNTESTNQSNQNNNNLAISTSHMLKNSEWGAVTYLASSKYGAGINNVQLNNSFSSGGTGTGPSGGAYNTADGQKASTTNNIYGVYDMAGGAWEYAMGGYTTNASQSKTNNYLSIAVKPPYVDLYVNRPFSGDYTSNNNLCTWATCGGHALYETKNVQSVSSVYQSWGGDYSDFVYLSYPWFLRGGNANDGSYAGLFGSDYGNGYTDYDYGFRVALLTIPQE